MYHYTECGLDNIWLKNGYEELPTETGSAYSVHNIDGLHETIALGLIRKQAPLTGKEFRFLRIELDLSQKALGDLLGKTDQQIANWEKGKNDIPVMADALIRQYCSEKMHKDSKLSELLDALKDLDRRLHELRFALEETAVGWTVVEEGFLECA